MVQSQRGSDLRPGIFNAAGVRSWGLRQAGARGTAFAGQTIFKAIFWPGLPLIFTKRMIIK